MQMAGTVAPAALVPQHGRVEVMVVRKKLHARAAHARALEVLETLDASIDGDWLDVRGL